MANFKDFSRYRDNIITKNRNSEDFIILRQKLDLEESEGDTFITLTKDLIKRPDLISSKAYGTPDLWWVIAEFNNIRDPLFDLRPGTNLRIPSLQRVLPALERLEI